jgi:hypothetical protein
MAAAITVQTTRSARLRAPAVSLATLALGLSLVTVGVAALPSRRLGPTARGPWRCRRRAQLRHAARSREVPGSPSIRWSARRSRRGGGEASCRFSARDRAAGALDVVAELDGAPQAYYRLDREVVEFGQNVIWDHLGARADPYPIPHLGLAADWFPSENQLVTTDGVRLMTIVVTSVSAGAGGDARVAASLPRAARLAVTVRGPSQHRPGRGGY